MDVHEDIDGTQSGHREECPACHSPGLLNGDPIGTVDAPIGDDEVIQRQGMLPSTFECVVCQLTISGFSRLSACGMGNAFTETSSYTATEYFNLYTEDDLEDARRGGQGYEMDNNEKEDLKIQWRWYGQWPNVISRKGARSDYQFLCNVKK